MDFTKLSSIRVWHKLLFLGVIAGVLCVVPTYLYIHGANKDIRDALTEIKGLDPATLLVRLLQPLQNHRGLAAAVLSGDQAQGAPRAATEKEVTAAMGKVRVALSTSATPLLKQLTDIETEWKSLAGALKDPTFPVEDSHSRHTKLSDATLRLLENTSDYFGLSLDPDAKTYHLIIAALMDIPELTESMGRIRAGGSAILSIKQATTEERVAIASQLERIRWDQDHSRVRIQKAIAANGTAMDKLDATSLDALNHTQKLIAVTDLEFMRIEVLRYASGDYLKLVTTAMNAQFNLIDVARNEIEQSLNARVASLRWTMAGLLGLIGALLLIGAGAMYWIARSITRPLNAAIGDAHAIAAGHLDTVIGDVGSDEVGQLRRAMRHMQRNLAHIVASIRENSESVASASREIASSTQNMSARTESQASSLEETAASMEALNTTFQKHDESSQHVSDLATKAAEAAEQGGVVVGKVTTTMQEIDVSSKKIAEIIGVIDSIAFQTNILALNAAVEAARAGEQGRGFAVVAAEVRALAQRSGQASKEIRSLISESVKKVQVGTREAAESRKAMDQILASVRTVATTMAQMQTVLTDQRQGVAQVTRAVEQMSQSTQQNAAMVEEIAATADALSGQAQDLTGTVSTFKLTENQGVTHQRPPDADLLTFTQSTLKLSEAAISDAGITSTMTQRRMLTADASQH
jgi:methyl-accepting chemotaxis protein